MRTLPLFVLPLLLSSGCAVFSGQPEGNWLLTLTETSRVCDGVEASDLLEPSQGLASSYQLKDGSYMFDFGAGAKLIGEATREGYDLRSRRETRLTDAGSPACTLFSEGSSIALVGTWGDDLMLQGVGTSEQWETYEDCYGITDESRCTYRFQIQGVLLNSTTRDHVIDGLGGARVFGALGGGGGGYF